MIWFRDFILVTPLDEQLVEISHRASVQKNRAHRHKSPQAHGIMGPNPRSQRNEVKKAPNLR
jgi:hypothetical protein